MSDWGRTLKNGEGREYVRKDVADAKLHHLNECLREIATLVVGSNFGKDRYPLAFNECLNFINQKGELKSKSAVIQQMTTEPVSIAYKLIEAANGHPHALIPWPHRLLHDAAARIKELELNEHTREAFYGERIAELEAENARLREENAQLCGFDSYAEQEKALKGVGDERMR
jgi:hypothetical protein